MSESMAERVLRSSDTGELVTARLHAPERIGQSSEWSCKIEVQGLDAPYERSIIGVDSFQALCLALRVLCAHLDKHARALKFLDGPTGSCGLPLIMPWSFDSALKAEMYRLIESKIREKFDSPRD
jgi:hypothetical protein